MIVEFHLKVIYGQIWEKKAENCSVFVINITLPGQESHLMANRAGEVTVLDTYIYQLRSSVLIPFDMILVLINALS